MSDPVPAIAEAAATGAIAEIFADIRGVLRVEVVNLIWRHLATLPGALPWVWGVLKPLYGNGTILAEAKALHSKLVLPHLPPFPPALLAADGQDNTERCENQYQACPDIRALDDQGYGFVRGRPVNGAGRDALPVGRSPCLDRCDGLGHSRRRPAKARRQRVAVVGRETRGGGLLLAAAWAHRRGRRLEISPLQLAQAPRP